MPPPCLHCDRSFLQSCFCYSFSSRRPCQLAPPAMENDYDKFRQERASLGKAYDDACEEEDRLACIYSEAQRRRLEIGRRFEASSPFASVRLLHAVMNVTELSERVLHRGRPSNATPSAGAVKMLDKSNELCSHSIDKVYWVGCTVGCIRSVRWILGLVVITTSCGFPQPRAWR